VSITLMQTSAVNGLFSAIFTGDTQVPGGQGIAPIFIRDKQGASIFSSPQAWITGPPTLGYAKEAKTLKWEFNVHDPLHFLGGN
jgi:hypothetical protein